MLGLLIGFSSHCNSLYHLFLFFSQMTHPSVTEQCHGKPTQPWRLCQSSTFPLPCAPASALGGRWDFKPPPAPLGQGGDHVLVGHYIPVHIPGWVLPPDLPCGFFEKEAETPVPLKSRANLFSRSSRAL